MYHLFWEVELLERSSDDQIAELLDNLYHRLSDLHSALAGTSNLTGRLLERALKAHGDHLDTRRLFNWLEVGTVRSSVLLNDEASRAIRSWLEQRPLVQKAIILEGLSRKSDPDHLTPLDSPGWRRLSFFCVRASPDIGAWLLEQSIALANGNAPLAKQLFTEAVQAHLLQTHNKGLRLEALQREAATNGLFEEVLSSLIPRRSVRQAYPEQVPIKSPFRERQKLESDQWMSYVRQQEAALRDNRAPPQLLLRIAQIYFGSFIPDGADDRTRNAARNSRVEAVYRLLQGNQHLIDAAFIGLRGVANRKDLPNVDEIISVRSTNSEHCLGLPLLACLDTLTRTSDEFLLRKEDLIRTAVGVYYCTPHAQYRPNWYERLIQEKPEIVANTRIRCATSEFRAGECIYKPWQLAHDAAHAQVARHAILPLLTRFPIRCKSKQVDMLKPLLLAALRHTDRRSLGELISWKLSRMSLNPSQRIHWLATGVLVSPDEYQQPLDDFVRGRDDRKRILASTFCSEGFFQFIVNELAAMILTIRLIGSYVKPDGWRKSGWVSPDMEAALLVSRLIKSLSEHSDEAVTDALDALVVDQEICLWHDEISQARGDQRVLLRDAFYQHPDVDQIVATLSDAVPSNAGDLAALLRGRLDELSLRIRNSNTDDWRQYWNEPHGQVPKPKHEDHCRDALLSDLRLYLPDGVDAQPEGQYAHDKRSDIRVSYQDFEIPVENKKSGDRYLWSAARNQLIAQYTIEPATGGYGIYLVFWFGKGHKQPPPSGPPPADADDLRMRLEETLSDAERRKISVVVIDVSRPV